MTAARRSIRVCALAALLARSDPAAAQEPPVRLTLELRNLAAVPPAVLRETRAEVERTFLASGVTIAWAPTASSPEDPTAVKVFMVGAARPGTGGRNPRGAVVGFAPRSGNWVQVFYGRVAAAVAERPVAISVILAHVIAHELGHLLLPSESHAPIGIMRRAVDLEHPALRRFTDEQSQLMRDAVAGGRRYWSRCDH